jgi:hypothetical protein
MLVSQ